LIKNNYSATLSKSVLPIKAFKEIFFFNAFIKF